MNEIYFGDCRDSLRAMAADGVKVQMCVTSPPYFGLRDYGHDGQIGLEETPEQFIAELVEVFRCVRDVLADDGVLWVNIGDTYASAWPCNRRNVIGSGSLENGKRENRAPRMGPGLKEKDLIGIPWMLAFALRADGWYLRQDIIWHKPNPMPESVTDRCTKAHEYVFLLSKSPRYYYDHEAIKEDAVKGAAGSNFNTGKSAEHQLGRSSDAIRVEDGKRNRRSVWSIATRPYKGAHFAVFPPALVEPCILAGTSEKGHCPECGARWGRQVERIDQGYDGSRYGERAVAATGGAVSGGTKKGTLGSSGGKLTGKSETKGWAPTCDCGHDPVPDIVLDPFMGSGTTAAVAIEHGRQFAGCELNPEYKPLQDQRIAEARAAAAEIEEARALAAAQMDLFAEKAPEAA